jgi:acetyltransferase-like isoleucine patch superfamily enzyme
VTLYRARIRIVMNFKLYYWAVAARLYSKFGPLRCEGRIRIVGFPVVKGRGTIRVGARSDLRSISWSTAMGVQQPCVLNALLETSRIKIGQKCGMSGAVICAKESVVLGNNVQLGSGVVISDTDFHSMDYQVRGQEGDLEAAQSAPVSIGDDCFIGARAIVLKGVTIGARSIVGAGAVVVKDVPADVVVAGNPARIVKSIKSV